MNQPPGGGYPPGPQYPGQPGFPQQGYPQQPQQAHAQQPAPVGQPGAAKPFMGTALMPGAPAIPGQMSPQEQVAAAQAAQAAAQQQQQYGGAPQAGYGAPQPGGYGAPQQPYGQPPAQGGYDPMAQQQQYGGAPQQGYGAPTGGPQQQAYPGAQPPYGAPPQGGYPGTPQGGYPGAPQGGPMQQQPQQGGGVAMPQFGIGGIGSHGMPHINLGGGDFSPAKLMGAITTGQGFASPRKMGAIMIGLSFLLGIANTVLVLVLHRYYPYLYSVGAIFGWAGTWLLVTGQPRTTQDGSPAPMWGRIGLACFFGIGVLVGAALCFFNWERMLAGAAIDGMTGN